MSFSWATRVAILVLPAWTALDLDIIGTGQFRSHLGVNVYQI